jgi:CheY-like chemotaxis protein
MTLPNLACPLPISLSPALVSLRVLVVDDDPDTRWFLRRTIVGAGGEVIAASSMDEATQVLQKLVPSIIVCDIGMPLRDGYDLIRYVRSLPAERGGRTPAIALTSYAGPMDRQRALEAGFDRHMSKPIDWDQLSFAIASLAR